MSRKIIIGHESGSLSRVDVTKSVQ